MHRVKMGAHVWVGGKLMSYRVEWPSYESYVLPELVPIATTSEVLLDKKETPVMMAYTYY